MKRLLLVTILLVGMIFAFSSTVEAQGAKSSETGNVTVAKLFPWATSGHIDWGQGGLLLGLGFVGALVTVFFLIGGTVPGTAGKVKIDKEEERLNGYNDILTKLVKNEPQDPEKIKAIEQTTNNLRDDLTRERRYQFGLGALIYLLLGAVFAGMLAQNLIEALVIGAGWTAVIGTLGLKTDYNKRKEIKDTASDELNDALATLGKRIEEQNNKIEMLNKMPDAAGGKGPPVAEITRGTIVPIDMKDLQSILALAQEKARIARSL